MDFLEKDEMRKIREKKRPIAVIILPLVAAALLFFYMAVKEQLPYWVSGYRSQIVQNTYTEFGEENKTSDEKPDKRKEKNKAPVKKSNGVDWEGLQKMNPDIIGWIRIPDTAVNYAILKGTSNDYYLNHHMDGSSNILGSIFAGYGTDTELEDPHMILYGHNMASGKMFGQLSNYANQGFWSSHPYMYIYTPDRTEKYAIYSAYNCPDSDVTYTTGFTQGSDDFKDWIDETIIKGYYRTEFTPTGDEKIFTLSTCADSGAINNRFVLNCMLIEREEL